MTATRRRLLPITLAWALAAPGAAGAPDPAKAEPQPEDVVSAFLTLREWIDDFELPAPEDPEARVPLRGAGGVCVILRRGGRVLGSGVDASGGELMARRAAARALGRVLADPVVANLPRDVGIGRALVLELEVAGSLVPLPGRSFEAVAAQLAPGLDGVALRRGDRVAMLFPAQMRAANTAGSPERMLPPLAAELGLAPMELSQLATRFEVSIYRFRATHLAQREPADFPFTTFRGDALVAPDDVTPQALRRLAAGIARRLTATLGRLNEPRPGREPAATAAPEPVGVLGTYRPAADRYDPLIAPPLEQALCAWALARYARVPRLDGDEIAAAVQASVRILDDLRRVVAPEADPLADAAACAAIVHAALELPAGVRAEPQRRAFLERAFAGARAAFAPGEGFSDAGGGPLAPHGRALVASALSRLSLEGAGGPPPAVARAAVDAAWASLPEPRQVSLLPWLGWAEADLADASDGPIVEAPRLRRLRELLDASRIGTPQRPGPPDLAGGFALTQRDRLAATAQTLRPAALLAWMAREPRLTPPPEAPAALEDVLATMRFVMQLAVRESAAWAYRNPGRALGGLRAAPWDADQPTAGQAMGLVAVAETLTSLEAVGGGG